MTPLADSEIIALLHWHATGFLREIEHLLENDLTEEQQAKMLARAERMVQLFKAAQSLRSGRSAS